MGIVNVTPDSFSDGGDHFSPGDAVNHAKKLLSDGADIIDFGAQSTRPGYEKITAAEEWARLEPVLTAFCAESDVPVSVDTFYPEVAQKALEAGADIINDVSGAVDGDMAELVKTSGCGWIIMHSGAGTPADVRGFFETAAEKCAALGIDKSQLCFDMGIGFGKDYEENLALLARVNEYKIPDYPLLLGVSRKRVIGQGSGQPEPKKRIYGNIAADTAAILGGADIVRLHDVANEKQGIMMADAIKTQRLPC